MSNKRLSSWDLDGDVLMDLKQSQSPGSTGGEFISSLNSCAAAPMEAHDNSRSRNSPADVSGTRGQSSEQHKQPFLFMSAPTSRGPTTRWQSCHDEGYGYRQDVAGVKPPDRPPDRVGCRSSFCDQEEEHAEDPDENDDDGFAWDSSLHEPKALRRSIDVRGIERRDPSLSPSGSASLTSAKSRNTVEGPLEPSPKDSPMPIPPSCSLPSTPDSKLNAGLEEAICAFQSWEGVHNVSFSGRSSQHQRCTSAMSVSLHSTASRVSDGMTLQSDLLHDEPLPLSTNLQFFQPPSRVSLNSCLSTPRSLHETEQVKLDLLEEQEKELVELAIERSKQDTLSKEDHFEPSLKVALVESMTTSFPFRSSPATSSSVSFSLSKPPLPKLSLNGRFSISEPSPPIHPTGPDVRPSGQPQPGPLLNGNFLSEPPPPIPSSFGADTETTRTAGCFQGSVSKSSSHHCNQMGPEDFSTSEVEEQRMLRMALQRSLHEPTSPRRPHFRTSSSPRYRNSRDAGGLT
jgi:hypothetical protein